MNYYEEVRTKFEAVCIRQDRERIMASLSDIIYHMQKEQPEADEALVVASEITYFMIFHMDHGRSFLTEFFKKYPKGYRCLFTFHSTEQVIDYLMILRNGLDQQLKSQMIDSKQMIVITVQDYIREHVREKISLSETAEAFRISASYLSTLFSQYSEYGFNDYVNHTKIDLAKQMLEDNTMWIYEIAKYLGFENTFYFSRVFKKMVGMAPSEYVLQSVVKST